MNSQLIGFVGALIVFVAIFVLSPLFLRPLLNRIVQGPAEKRAQGQQLMATGSKARAMVTAIQPTGTIVNRVHIQCVIQFRIQPLDGTEQFGGEKKAYLLQTQLPRQGDVWPCWFDASDRSKFVLSIPDLADPAMPETFRQFGIANPLDRLESA